MSLSIVNTHVPTLSWKKKKSLLNNSLSGKTKISPKRCNALQPKCQISNDSSIALSKDEIEKYAQSSDHKPYNSFPSDFVFGAASSAFQVEGATKANGKGPSIWDTFCEKYPEKIIGAATGEPGAGSYKHYEKDVEILADLGLKAYRFSISWSRVLPNGSGQPNEHGLKYYHNLIDELKKHDIEPFVTLFHWDVPQALEDKYGGFLSRKIVEDYKNYAELCFREFGDKVKHWITMNEPSMFIGNGYSTGMFAPGHCTPDLPDFNCPQGDSLREPYKVAHNILLAHAEAANLYKAKYQAKQGGKVGITLVTMWYVPYDNSPLNVEAQKRGLDFNLGWYLDPLKFGNYPFSMRALLGDRLPIFTEEESAKLKDSFDFIGLNYYTARYARDKPYNYTTKTKISQEDAQFDELSVRGNVPIGPAERGSWVNVYPKGLTGLIMHVKERYNNPDIYITENGVLDKSTDQPKPNHGLPIPIAKPSSRPPTEDIFRIEYHVSHLHAVEDALSQKANVKGYFVWSLLDSLEWQFGYGDRFGLYYIDNLQDPELRRIPKQSALWLKDYLRKNKIAPTEPIIEEEGPFVVPVPISSINLLIE